MSPVCVDLTPWRPALPMRNAAMTTAACGALVLAMAVFGRAEACASIGLGTTTSAVGRSVYMTYDVNRDDGCAGGIGFDAAHVALQPQHGQAVVAFGRFRYTVTPGNVEGDRFVVQGLQNGKPARMTVTVKFQ